MKKIVRLGTVPVGRENASVFCSIEFTDERLSISGVEGPLRNGNAIGSCGQIDMHLRKEQDKITLAPGWSKEMLAHFFDVWEEYHLNDMQAGTPKQTAALKQYVYPGYPANHYEWSLQTLATIGPFTVWCYDDLTEEEDASYWAAALGGNMYRFKRKPRILATSRTFETRAEAEHYASAIASGREAQIRGLDCDNGYRYGAAWLKVEVPADAIAFLESLPDTDVTPAWAL